MLSDISSDGRPRASFCACSLPQPSSSASEVRLAASVSGACFSSDGPFQVPSFSKRVSTAPPKDEPTINRVSGRMAARARSRGTRKSCSIYGQGWYHGTTLLVSEKRIAITK